MALVLSATAVVLGEATSNTFTVRLSARPASNTTVTLSSEDIGAASVTPGSMSFTSTTWNMAQLVTISGVSDMDMVGESVAVTVRSAG